MLLPSNWHALPAKYVSYSRPFLQEKRDISFQTHVFLVCVLGSKAYNILRINLIVKTLSFFAYSRVMNKLLEKTFSICVKNDFVAEGTLPKNVPFSLKQRTQATILLCKRRDCWHWTYFHATLLFVA